jgi:hypothetical protein
VRGRRKRAEFRKALAHSRAVLQKFNSELAHAMRQVIACEADEADL